MNSAYPLFSISILVILFYAFSAALVRIGLISKTNNRKFWNFLLLIAFLITGLIGLLSVVKVNYKLAFPYYDELLSCHVEFGIGMVVIGAIHFWWHLSYYLSLLTREKSKETPYNILIEADLNTTVLLTCAFLLGSTSMISQIILLREFMAVFNGNELVIGLVLASWMALTGIGAYLGRQPLRIRKTSNVIFPALLLLSGLPLVVTFLVNFLKNKVFPIGAMIDVFQIFFSTIILLIPFCLVSGFLFTVISRCYSEIRKEIQTGFVYGFESAGSITGGLVCGLIFIFLFSSVESLLILAGVNGLLLFLISSKQGTLKFALASVMVALSAFTLLFFQPEKAIRSWVYPNQKIEVSKDSPYGNIVITRRNNMLSVYNNNLLVFDSENFIQNEEAVHFAMLQHPHPSKVLLISGGLSGQITELKKYYPVSIDYVEDNPWLLALMKDSLEKILTKGIMLYEIDPLRFLRNTTRNYDVVLLNLPGPSTLQANRFYTLEFFKLVKSKLSQGAILSFGLAAPANYMNREAVDVNSTIYATLKKVFQNVIIIQGEKFYFLASDTHLTYNIVKTTQERGIQNRYVNPYYLDDSSLQRRGEFIVSALNPSSDPNRNLKPVLFKQELAFWLSSFNGKYWWMLGMAIVMALFVFLSGNAPSKAMFLTGFSATGLEILLLFGLQIYFGNIFLLTGFVFTGFMLGLSGGSFLGKSLNSCASKEYLNYNQFIIAIFAFITGLLLLSPGVANLGPAIIYALFFGATVVIGGLTGFQFTKASLSQTGNYSEISGRTYSYDLFGSALGALTMTIYLVPKLGISTSALFIGFLNMVFGIYLTLMKNRV